MSYHTNSLYRLTQQTPDVKKGLQFFTSKARQFGVVQSSSSPVHFHIDLRRNHHNLDLPGILAAPAQFLMFFILQVSCRYPNCCHSRVPCATFSSLRLARENRLELR